MFNFFFIHCKFNLKTIHYAKKNDLGKNALGHSSIDWLERLHKCLEVGNYGKGTIRNYMSEMRLLFQYYHEKDLEYITQSDINDYIIYIKKVHGLGYAKCRNVAHACSFFVSL